MITYQHAGESFHFSGLRSFSFSLFFSMVQSPLCLPHFSTTAKAKTQLTKVNINAALVEDIISLEEVKENMAGVLATLKDDFSRNLGIRTSPGQDSHTHIL